ncbi:hypothetical protein [Flavobacterium sp. J27]|uniref:hypothetical protein n=1 Tax=Flavobacterium sp. J27 TaxID=2060419 RepID=UPI00102FBC57|nr:hypothetical protein [Flavobacterium sp. J27]
MKKNLLFIAILFSTLLVGQEKYKYIVVPQQFSFFTEPNKYNLNSLTKSFFESEGLTVFYDGEDLPEAFLRDKCQVLYANAIKNSTIFNTKITIEVKDCQNKILITSIEGNSREKSYDTAYSQAFREALTSLKGKVDFQKTFTDKANTTKSEVTIEEAKVLSNTVVAVAPETTSNKTLLFALPTETGFKLVNAVPNVIFELQKTTIPDLFLAERGMLDNGIFYKKEGNWFYEYYKKGKLIVEKVEVKF